MLREFRTQRIIWDTANSRLFDPIQTSGGDQNGRRLEVQILNNGEVEDLTGTDLYLAWQTRNKNHSGLELFDALDASEGIFELYYPTGMLAHAGALRGGLALVDSDGRIVSREFIIQVDRNIVDDEVAESSNEFTALTEALIKVNNLEENYAPQLNSLTAQLAHKVGEWGLGVRKNSYETTREGGVDHKIHLMPFNVEYPTVINRVRFEVTKNALGATFELGIYDENFNLVCDSDIKETFEGVNEVALNYGEFKVGTYYFAFVTNSSALEFKLADTNKALSSNFVFPLPESINNVYEDDFGVNFKLLSYDLQTIDDYDVEVTNGIRVMAIGSNRAGLYGWNTNTGKVCVSLNSGDLWTDLMPVSPGGFWAMRVDQTNNIIFTLTGDGDMYKSSDLTSSATWQKITPPKREHAISLPSSLELWGGYLWYGEYSGASTGELAGGGKVFKYNISTSEWTESSQFTNSRHIHSFTTQGSVALFVMIGDANYGDDIGFHRLTQSGLNASGNDNWTKWSGIGGNNSTLYNITGFTHTYKGVPSIIGSCDQKGSLITITKIGDTIAGQANISPLVRTLPNQETYGIANSPIMDSNENLYFVSTAHNGGKKQICVSPPPYTQTIVLAEYVGFATDAVRSGDNIFFFDKKIKAVTFNKKETPIIKREYLYNKGEILPFTYQSKGTAGTSIGVKNEDNLYLEAENNTSGAVQSSNFNANEAVDMTDYNKIVVEGEFLPSHGSNAMVVALYSDVGLTTKVKEQLLYNDSDYVNNRFKLTLDLRDVQGDQFIRLYGFATQENALLKARVDRMYLSRI